MIDANQKKRIFLGLSAATGGVVAVLADLMQKGEASAVENLASVLRIPQHLGAAAILLVALSVALSFIYGAESNQKAFTTGAGILALLVTLTPNKAVPTFDTVTPSGGSSSSEPVVPTKDVGWLERLVIPGTVYAQGPSAPGMYTAQLKPSDGKSVSDALFLLIDPSSGQVVRRSRVLDNRLAFYAPNSSYRLRVQVDGYQIAEVSLPNSPGPFSVPLTRSSIPVSLQRLYR